MSPTVSTSFSLEKARPDKKDLPTDEAKDSQLIEMRDTGETCDTSETSESGKKIDESLTLPRTERSDVDSKKASRSESFDETEDEAKMLNPPDCQPQVPRTSRTS